MACTLRDQTLSLLFTAALLLLSAEAASVIAINAKLTLHLPRQSLFDLNPPFTGNLTVAQAEQAATSLATSWGFTSPSSFAQLAGRPKPCTTSLGAVLLVFLTVR